MSASDRIRRCRLPLEVARTGSTRGRLATLEQRVKREHLRLGRLLSTQSRNVLFSAILKCPPMADISIWQKTGHFYFALTADALASGGRGSRAAQRWPCARE